MKRLVPLAALALLVLSCSPVPYSADLEAAAGTVARMSQDAGANVTLEDSYGSTPSDLTFFPHLTPSGFDYTSGFTASSDGTDISIRGFIADSSTGKLVSCMSGTRSVPNPDTHSPIWLAWPVKDTSLTTAYLYGEIFDSLYPQTANRYTLPFLNTTTGSSGTIDDNDMHNEVNSSCAVDTVVLGASMAASTSTTIDYTNWLAWRVTTPNYYVEFQTQVSSAGLVMAEIRAPMAGLSFLPAPPTHIQYFYDLNEWADAARTPNASFASWYDTGTGGWVCWRWYYLAGYVSQQLPIDHRIDAILSTGQLLSTEGGTGRLYDRDGNLLATFPLGSLRFVAEVSVGGVMRTYFSEKLVYNNTIHFSVYWIASSQLATLGR